MESVDEWANFTFSKCDLGDLRRTARLIKTATNLASNIGHSIVKSSPSEADIEGTYRLVRNKSVKADDIAEGGFLATVELVKQRDVVLALEDSTSLNYQHSVTKELSYTGKVKSGKSKGFVVHSVMMYDPKAEHTLGLLEQRRWIRDEEQFGKRKNKRIRAYETKESFKWQQASESLAERLGDDIHKCISVCDREADIIEYLSYKKEHGQRFIVRAKSNRPLTNEQRLYDYAKQLTPAGQYDVKVAQRGGRASRVANMEVSYAPVTVKAPEKKQSTFAPIDAHVVICQERTDNKSPLTWVLLTTETVNSKEDALQMVKYYETRWKIEEFHMVWKSEGTHVEKLKMQHADNLEKVAVILAFAAVRLIQLKDWGDKADAGQESCELCLSRIHWQLLWRKQHPKKPFPKSPPSMKWAYHALGKLAGWNDSKRTGRVGWKTLWEGWEKLESLYEGLMMFKEMDM